MKLMYIVSKIIKKINIPSLKNSEVHKNSKVCSASQVVNSSINKYSYVGNGCTVVNTEIGSFCSIADNCIIGGASHPIDWVSTSPVFHEGKNVLRKNFSSHSYNTVEKTIIENDVWIGSNCLIKSGVKIKNGAVIGMGSVVTKDIGSYEIWAGNPAKKIKNRFPEDTAEFLSRSQWWNYTEESLEEIAKKINDVEVFKKELRN